MIRLGKNLGLESDFIFIILTIVLITIPGCEKKELKNQINYLQGEVDGLQEEVVDLETENENLQGRLKDISRLEKELKAMRTKIDSVSQLPATLYSKAHSYYENKQYNDCMALLILVSEKYPDWDRPKVEKKYNLAYKKQEEYVKEQGRLSKKDERKRKREAQMIASIEKNVESVYDKKKGITYYKTLRATICQVEHTVSFGIELYMIVNKSGKKIFRLKSTYMDKSGSDYHDPQWMNYNEIELISDNGNRLIIKIDESKKEFIESKFINKETSDDMIDMDQILNFHGSNRLRVYFKGKYFYEFDMTYEQVNAFREILANYDYI
tara:strand:+ start:1041 stop:2012 length:972 start_codon:yes stop_codon:yes gene_type:complete